MVGSPTQDLANRVNRGLPSQDAARVTACIRRKHDLLSQCGAFDRDCQPERQGNWPIFADRLDNDALIASLTAEKALPQVDKPAWSLELAEAHRVVNLLSRHLSFLRTGREHSPTFHCKLRRLSTPLLVLVPETQSTKVVSYLVLDSIERREEERNMMIKSLEISEDTAQPSTFWSSSGDTLYYPSLNDSAGIPWRWCRCRD